MVPDSHTETSCLLVPPPYDGLMVDGRLMTLGGIRVGGVQKEGTSAYPALLLAARWLLLVLLVLLARWLAGSLAAGAGCLSPGRAHVMVRVSPRRMCCCLPTSWAVGSMELGT